MVSPLISDKRKGDTNIQLLENDKLISNSKDVAELFNNKFISIADDMGKDSQYFTGTTNHPSYNLISEHMRSNKTSTFQFKSTNVYETSKILGGLNPNSNKAVGYDKIPAKALKCGREILSPTICNLARGRSEQM